MKSGDPIIRLRNVHKSLDGQVVLDGVSLDVLPGQTTVVIGPSGCGKSVLLKHIVALMRPDRGEVYFHGRLISSMGERQLVAVRRRMGLLFQAGALFDSMTVEQNICFPMAEHGVPAEAAVPRGPLAGRAGRVAGAVPRGAVRRAAEAGRAGPGDRAGPGGDPLRRADDRAGPDPRRPDQRADPEAPGRAGHDGGGGGRFIADTTPDGLDELGDPVVTGFVHGRAGRDELERIEAGREMFRHARAADTEDRP